MQKLLSIRPDPGALLSGLLLFTVVFLLPLMYPASGQNPQPVNAAVGIDFYQKGNYEAAIKNLRQAVKGESKNDPAIWNYLGLSLLKKNDLKEARKAFEKAVKLKPDNEAWRINLAYVLLQTGEM